MRVTRSPLIPVACRLYRLMLWMYPARLRVDFRDELVITFRNLAEDAFDSTRPVASLLFAAHIAADLLRGFALEPPAAINGRLSLLGLAPLDEEACGSIDRSSVDASLFFAALGVVLLFVGWYAYLTAQSTYLGHHRVI